MTKLNFKLFGRTGLRVSEICLGTMTFGTEWGTGADYEESRKIFDAYCELGGNFLDTANRYTEGTSEKWLGEFIAGRREYFVLASKYSLTEQRDNVNASGNHRKNMMFSVEQSLRRLNTEYLDILWVHAWDFLTPVEEVMRGLDDLVRQGKVHYVAISDTPAWIVSKANTMAELRGWTPFCALQVEYSLIQRTPERDLLPMAAHFGMSVTPWSPLGGGVLTGKHNKGAASGARLTEKSTKLSERNLTIARKVAQVAEQIGRTPAQVALNWVRQMSANHIPIVGARTQTQLLDTMGCLEFSLSAEDMLVLNEASAIELGFPHDFLKQPTVQAILYGNDRERILM